MAIAIDNIKGLNLFDVFQSVLGFIAPPLAAVFLLSVYWKRTNTMAVNSVLSAGSVLSLGVGALYLWVFPADTYSFWPHYLMLSFYLFAVLFVMGISISLVGSAVVRPSREQVPVAPRRLSHSVRMAWLALWAVMIVLYILFK